MSDLAIAGGPMRFGADIPARTRVLHILTPTRGTMAVEQHIWFQSSRNVFGALGFNHVTYNYEPRKPVDEARETLAKRVIGFLDVAPLAESYCLWIDDDTIPNGDALSPLFGELARHADIDALAALCARKVEGDYGVIHDPTDLRQMIPGADYEPGEVVEVGFTGMGFMIHRATLLRDIPEPRFKSDATGAGEDRWFCEQMRAAGKRVFVHTGVKVGHIDSVSGTVFFPNPGARKQMAKI